ncbi:MAG: hypothetical protein E7Z87_08215 [Cyanobacteria bacterium SIG26]|nr:hypothetical protein [Cyanobacteria bacterium SIG26]
MNKDELLRLNNVLVDKDGFEVVALLLKQLGAFERNYNHTASDREVFMTQGYRNKGLWLLDNCFKANPEKYIELLNKNERGNL